MSLFIENSLWVFVFLTVILGGGAAFQAGRAMAGRGAGMAQPPPRVRVGRRRTPYRRH